MDEPPEGPPPTQAELARRANTTAYERKLEAEYVNGAPHVKHSSTFRLYTSLVHAALGSIDTAGRKVRVLDLGCGSGLASMPWLEAGASVTGVDTSREMLTRFERRARDSGAPIRTVESDLVAFVDGTDETFDAVSIVSTLHHVPDYQTIANKAARIVAPSGSLLTFQDPLRFDRMQTGHRGLERAAYFAWRLGQGNWREGVRTRLRRLRGTYEETRLADFEEYHVVRNGVDSDLLCSSIEPYFSDVSVVKYWSTFAPLLQRAGQHLRLQSHFGILATNRR